MLHPKDRVAMVSGASRGIGRLPEQRRDAQRATDPTAWTAATLGERVVNWRFDPGR